MRPRNDYIRMSNEDIKLLHGDCVELMRDIDDKSIDAIITDPPYQYLKNHKLDIPFNESHFFAEVKRVLKDGGFIVMFGRGTAFYRWNTRLSDLGFTFKEEIIWNKKKTSSPVAFLLRAHETVSIHCKGKNSINKVRIPYMEMKGHDMDKIVKDIQTLKSVFTNSETLEAVQKYIETGDAEYNKMYVSHNDNICIHTNPPKCNGAINAYKAMHEGCIEKSIIEIPPVCGQLLHPTQKPARLMERLTALVTQENACVLDPFTGSGSTGIACINTNRRFIGMELDAQYFNIAKSRIEKAQEQKQPELFKERA